jgi:hypothetical protein
MTKAFIVRCVGPDNTVRFCAVLADTREAALNATQAILRMAASYAADETVLT